MTTGGDVVRDHGAPALRGDIQALRMLAVTSVLLFHLWPGRVAGGYVGVDVFFAISGFLITSHLLREIEVSGRLRLGRFWARRAKRLLPAALLVLLVTALAVMALAPLGDRAQFLREVVGATLYVENWVLAREAVDYLAADDAVSPVQHFWTLSVEEQFYVGVPLVLAACTLLGRRLPARRRTGLVVAALALVAAASLAYSVSLTATDPSVAYFSTGTRAWEFVLGGLLGCWMARPDVVLARPLAHVLSWGGLAAILAAVVAFDGGTPFPGYAAALPVLGTVAVIAARSVGPVALLGRLAPVRLVGDVSYATYLWHWPLIVMVPFVTEHRLTDLEKVAIGLGSLVLAWLSTRFIEDPVRFSPRLLGSGRSARTVGVVCAAAMVVVAGTALVGARDADRDVAAVQERAEALLDSTDLTCLGANAVDGRHDGCPDLGDAVVPAPAAASLDDHNDVACWATNGVTDPHVCRLPGGRPDGLRVLAVGDSHNNVYLPWYESLAKEQGWQVDVTGRAGCAWGTWSRSGEGTSARECAQWREGIAELLARRAPYDVILTTSKQSGALPVAGEGSEAEEATVAGLQAAWQEQIARGATVVAIRDNPLAREDVLQCVEEHGIDAATECALPRRAALTGYDALAEAVRRTPGSAIIGMRDLVCERGRCRPVVGNVAVYRDPSHLTATFVRTLVPTMTERLLSALDTVRADG